MEFKAIIISEASKVLTKSNGGAYILQGAKITSGHLKGEEVTSTRTILNSAGKEKDVFPVGTEVTLHMSIVPSKEDPTKSIYFFEQQGNEVVVTNHDAIAAKLAKIDVAALATAGTTN